MRQTWNQSAEKEKQNTLFFFPFSFSLLVYKMRPPTPQRLVYFTKIFKQFFFLAQLNLFFF